MEFKLCLWAQKLFKRWMWRHVLIKPNQTKTTRLPCHRLHVPSTGIKQCTAAAVKDYYCYQCFGFLRQLALAVPRFKLLFMYVGICWKTWSYKGCWATRRWTATGNFLRSKPQIGVKLLLKWGVYYIWYMWYMSIKIRFLSSSTYSRVSFSQLIQLILVPTRVTWVWPSISHVTEPERTSISIFDLFRVSLQILRNVTVFSTNLRKPSMDDIPTDLVLSASLLSPVPAAPSHPYEPICGIGTDWDSVYNRAICWECETHGTNIAGMVIVGRMWKPYLRTRSFLVSHALSVLRMGRSRGLHWPSKHPVFTLCELW